MEESIGTVQAGPFKEKGVPVSETAPFLVVEKHLSVYFGRCKRKHNWCIDDCPVLFEGWFVYKVLNLPAIKNFEIVIQFSRFELENGLRVIVHEDRSTPLAVVNLLYNVGSRDESPEKTGFAHLFEHLMFAGSQNVDNFDDVMQRAGGENNAFTNSDITNFYNILPAQNIETALWLESDRMSGLIFDERALEIQKRVVVEEFKESCLSEPYGDVWHHLTDMAYKIHPYRWPTIGKTPEHIENATIEDVKQFYEHFYCPNNAVLAVTGNVSTVHIEKLVNKWFADIPRGRTLQRTLPVEPSQTRLEKRISKGNIPVDALYLAFHTGARLHPDYYATDLLSDILCNGGSSRLYRKLLKDEKLFVSIDCYISGSIDPGLLIIEGKPAPGVTLERATEAVWGELTLLQAQSIQELELQKWKNKIESTLVFSELNILNKAINLSFFELLDHIDLVNREIEHYRKIVVEDITRVAKDVLKPENCSELCYTRF